LFDEVTQFERAIWLDLCRLRARAGYGDDCTLLIWALVDVPLDKQAAIIRAMLQELKDLLSRRTRIIYSKFEYYTMAPALQKDPTYLDRSRTRLERGLARGGGLPAHRHGRAEKQMANSAKRASRPRGCRQTRRLPGPARRARSSLRTMPRSH